MSIRRAIAAYLCPEMVLEAARYWRLWHELDTADKYLGKEFPQVGDTLKRLLQGDRDHWRKIEEPATGTFPTDIQKFREYLQRNKKTLLSDEVIEATAKEMERHDKSPYEWTEEQFEIWWTKDPLFCTHVRNHFDGFRGTDKEYALHRTRVLIQGAIHARNILQAAGGRDPSKPLT